MKQIIVTALIGVSLMAGQAQARSWDHYEQHSGRGDDYAKVVRVDPIIQQVEQRVPREQCWQERVPVRAHRSRDDSITDELIGGLIGGAIGNAIGHNKSNKRVQAVIGAAIGASIAHDLNRPRNHGYDTGYREVNRCSVSHDVHYRDVVAGYNVTYRYHGKEYHTRMNHHPGKRIRVNVDVSPAY